MNTDDDILAAGRRQARRPATVPDPSRFIAHRQRNRRAGLLSLAILPVLVLGLAVVSTGFGQTQDVTVTADDPEPAPTTTAPVDAVPVPPSCEATETFAESLTETGVSYDYDASDSPEEMLRRADAVFAGILTGDTDVRPSEQPLVELGFAVRVETRFKGLESSPDTVWVWAPYAKNFEESAARAAEVAAGTPVAVFAFDESPAGTFDLSVSAEGLTTSCPGGPLLGLVSTQGEWPAIPHLDALTQRLDAVGGSASGQGSEASSDASMDPLAMDVCPREAEGMRTVGGTLVAGFDTTVADVMDLVGPHDEAGDAPAVMCWYQDAEFLGALEAPAATTDVVTVYLDGQLVYSGTREGPAQRP